MTAPLGVVVDFIEVYNDSGFSKSFDLHFDEIALQSLIPGTPLYGMTLAPEGSLFYRVNLNPGVYYSMKIDNVASDRILLTYGETIETGDYINRLNVCPDLVEYQRKTMFQAQSDFLFLHITNWAGTFNSFDLFFEEEPFLPLVPGTILTSEVLDPEDDIYYQLNLTPGSFYILNLSDITQFLLRVFVRFNGYGGFSNEFPVSYNETIIIPGLEVPGVSLSGETMADNSIRYYQVTREAESEATLTVTNATDNIDITIQSVRTGWKPESHWVSESRDLVLPVESREQTLLIELDSSFSFTGVSYDIRFME